jgi:tetratricopeptide (TPR) repeat protein
MSLVGVLLVLGLAFEVYDYNASAAQRAEEQVQEAKRLLSPGNYERAVLQLDRALQTDPNSWDAYLQRGLANQNLEKPANALKDFDHALALKPDLQEALNARAELFRQNGDTRRAIEELTKLITLKPDLTAHFSRGLAYAELGQHEPAVSDFSWVIEQSRDAPFAYFARAKSKRALGDEKGAVLDEHVGFSFNRGVIR